MDDLKEHIDLEINGQMMSPETYEVVKFVNGDIKIIAKTYQSEIEKWATEERRRIFKNPEEYRPEEHETIFTEEEVKNLHQSMRP